jgi:hypothetical protein
MSTAPRPQTSPSTSSPPKGSLDQPSGVTGTTSVCPLRHSSRPAGSVALDAGDERGAPRRCVEQFEVDPAALEEGAEHLGVADLLAGLDRALVHAGVADHPSEQLDGLRGQRGIHTAIIAHR